MKLLILLLLISGACFGQKSDSIRLEVTKARSGADRTYYWLKDGDKRKYYTVCSCEQKHKKGDIVFIAKKDIEFIEPKN